MNKRVTRRPRRKRTERNAPTGGLGAFLSDLRMAKGMSLRQVEEATDWAVSNAYLSQMERGKIRQPSPNVLHSLAKVYAVAYETLMERAGYPLPSHADPARRPRRTLFAIDDLTADEEAELLKYLAFLRSRRASESRS
jgi:HTH-type transcriptional regulator, competence development regulator